MNKCVLAMTVLAAMSASPAHADGEGRAEVRSGVAWSNGTSFAFAGIGGGYDFDLGKKAFVGIDVGVDKVLARGTDFFGSAGGRVGIKAGEGGRAYVVGGLGFCCGGSDPYIGAGYQQRLRGRFYGKIEYRRVLSAAGPNVNFAGAGLGIKF